MRRTHLLLLVVLLFGFLVRVQAFQWNWFMHADVADDAVVATSVHRDGRFSTYSGPTMTDPSQYPALPSTDAMPIVMHGPLLPGLAAAVTTVRGGASTVADGYVSLRILSVLAGVLVILLSFFVASRFLSPFAGLSAAAWTASSYILIDYSGNGAHYTLQAVAYLLWLYVALGPPSTRRVLLLGAITGVAYLNNFQAVILLPATLLVIAMQERPWTRCMRHAALFLGMFFLIAAPWLVRNALVFGDPLYSHAYNMGYVYGKAGLAVPAGGRPDFVGLLGVLHGVFTLWMPNNLYYAARKLFLLAPFAFFLFSYGLIDVAFSRERWRRSFPLLVLLALQLLMYAGWPIWKFRFFVPLLPLVFLLALEQLHHLRVSPAWKYTCVGATLVSLLLLSVLMFRATPTHTVYFDGALTQDPFHSSEEETYLRKHGLFSP